MDFGDFGKAVDRVGRQVGPVLDAVAPAYKTGVVTVVSVTPAAAAAPFLAALPAETMIRLDLVGATLGLSLLSPDTRPDPKKVDYARIGELAAMAYLKQR